MAQTLQKLIESYQKGELTTPNIQDRLLIKYFRMRS